MGLVRHWAGMHGMGYRFLMLAGLRIADWDDEVPVKRVCICMRQGLHHMQ
jgi:hypothetical protein